MKSVKATREGLIGELTASGYRIDTSVPFVALPDVNALFHAVRVVNPANGRRCVAMVLDVGPWEIHDSAYVFGDDRPFAECGSDSSGRKTNHAGIDLGEAVWRRLGLRDNTQVEWEFID